MRAARCRAVRWPVVPRSATPWARRAPCRRQAGEFIALGHPIAVKITQAAQLAVDGIAGIEGAIAVAAVVLGIELSQGLCSSKLGNGPVLAGIPALLGMQNVVFAPRASASLVVPRELTGPLRLACNGLFEVRIGSAPSGR